MSNPVISQQPARSTFISSSVIKAGKDIRSKDIKTLAVSMQIMYYELEGVKYPKILQTLGD